MNILLYIYLGVITYCLVSIIELLAMLWVTRKERARLVAAHNDLAKAYQEVLTLMTANNEKLQKLVEQNILKRGE